ncbi:hypothetical protein CHN50_10555 [Priestia aryabhattai]|nr:hypothetical protein CHN50_10555 [Priestia aryabhattai]TDB55188.1 DUF2515 domain-containing protein [Bacillus sp. CBEL-1]
MKTYLVFIPNVKEESSMLTSFEQQVVDIIKRKTKQLNIDNISRTEAYATFYNNHPEIKWSFLASMVSRNAGWNMCDLQGKWFPELLSTETRDLLFLTYERANWLIFQDAFPQLLLYEVSKQHEKSYFHLLQYFYVSPFMYEKWTAFWGEKREIELMHALIINEQHIIEPAVVEHPFYQKKVFHRLLFHFQDSLHFSSVLFPTIEGEIYGCSVHSFTKVDERIKLGKKLGELLFSQALYPKFLQFSMSTVHTGSRVDYEQYIFHSKKRDTPYLRTTFPIVSHHEKKRAQWEISKRKEKKLMKELNLSLPTPITEWYQNKQKQLHVLVGIKKFFR